MSKAIEFLKTIGVPEDVVTAIESANDETDLSSLVDLTENHFTNYYKERVKDEIHKAGKGSAYAEAKNFVKKQFALTEAEIKELDFQGVLKLVNDRVSEKSGNKDLLEQLNQAKQTIIDYENRVKDFEETVIPSIKSESESAIRSFKVNQAIQSEVSKHPLIGASQYVVPGFTSDFNKKYKVEVDDSGTAIVTDLNGAKVYDKNKKELTLSELIVIEGKESKIFKESNGGEPQPGKTNNPTPPVPTPAPAKNQISKWQQESAQRVAEMKQRAGLNG
jgi:hypothetical protein